MNQAINFTSNAARKVFDLIREEGNPALMLRVFVQGGGCSGFEYGFTFDETQNEDDMVITRAVAESAEAGSAEAESGETLVKLLVDPLSFQYLTGAEIDYREDIHGSQFVIRNPNAKRTCGCGSSFATE